MVDLENFELTQTQRKYLGLRKIHPDWTVLEKTPYHTPEFFYRPVSERITIYYDIDFIIRKAIYRRIGMPGNYYECDIDAYVDLDKSVFAHSGFIGDGEFEDFNYHSFEIFCAIGSFVTYDLSFSSNTIYFANTKARCRFSLPWNIKNVDDLNHFLNRNIKPRNYNKSNF